MLVAAFASALALPGLALMFTASNTTTLFENRPAAPWPSLMVAGFAPAFERALADRFGGRDTLIHLHHFTKVVVFGVSPVPNVLLGRRGWLYYKGDDARDLATVNRHGPPPTAAAPSEIAKGIVARRRYLAERGIGYLLVVVPDKHTVYPEHVPPAWVPLLRPSSWDTVLAHLGPEDRAHVVDLRPPLMAAKRDLQVYYRTDSHWNGSGGWIGYAQILAALQREMAMSTSPPKPLPPRQRAGEVSGDLARMLGVSYGFVEPRDVVALPPGEGRCARNEAGAPPVWAAPRQLLRCPSAPLGRAAIYHDSMGLELLALLSNDLQESLWVSGRQWDLMALAQAPPTVLIDQIVERNLPLLADSSFLGGTGAVQAHTPAAAPPWRLGMPTGYSLTAPKSRNCTVDLVDGRPAAEVIEPRPGQDHALLFEGWAANISASQLPEVAWLVLQGAGLSFHLPVELRRPRPDVASAFGKPILAAAGYRVAATHSGLPSGTYSVSIVWTEASGGASCDTRKELRLGAPR